eukprot:5141341-Amphidinium_carterae.1
MKHSAELGRRRSLSKMCPMWAGLAPLQCSLSLPAGAVLALLLPGRLPLLRHVTAELPMKAKA